MTEEEKQLIVNTPIDESCFEKQCGKKYIESLRQRIHSLETENASFRKENKKLRQQFFELKSKIVDLIYNDENCLDKTIELLDDFKCELEEDEK